MDLKNHGEGVDETDDDNDGENEDDLDGGDKETDIEVLEGQCLLPRLKDLHLVIRPRNKLLLELVRSRWKPSLRNEETSRSDSNNVSVCLQTLSVRYPGEVGKRARRRLEALQKRLEKLQEDGMGVEVNFL